MRLYNTPGSFVTMLTLVIYLVSAVQLDTVEICNVAIDAGRPLHIVWPFEIAVVGDSGERGLRIGPKIGRGWKGEAGGSARYPFYIPRDGNYTLWMHCLWHDPCANAVFARMDDANKVIIGNDPVMNQWHWVRGVSFALHRGTHTLELANHSDHVAVQKLFLTNFTQVLPDQATAVFADIFYDGFDGCDQGNFSQWQIVSGQWRVQNPCDARNTAQNFLIGTSTSSALIILNNDQWSNYSLNVSVLPVSARDPNAAVGFCFGLKSPDKYYQLKCQYRSKKDTSQIRIIHKTSEKCIPVADFEVPWQNQRWHDVQISLGPGTIQITIDGLDPFRVSCPDAKGGGIGLSLEGNITTYFDNVHIRQMESRKGSQ